MQRAHARSPDTNGGQPHAMYEKGGVRTATEPIWHGAAVARLTQDFRKLCPRGAAAPAAVQPALFEGEGQALLLIARLRECLLRHRVLLPRALGHVCMPAQRVRQPQCVAALQLHACASVRIHVDQKWRIRRLCMWEASSV